MQHDPEGDDRIDDSLADSVDELLASVGETLERPPAPAPPPRRAAAKSDGDDSLDAHVDELLTEVSRSVDSLPPERPRPLVEPRGSLTILEQDDLVAARAFYEDILGLTADDVGATSVRYRLGHDSFVMLTEASPAANEGGVIVLPVRDLDEARGRLESAGVTVEAPDDLLEALSSLFVRDPSGHLVGLAIFDDVE